MKSTIIHVGLDVDDTQYHGSALHRDGGEVIDFQCRPTLKGLLSQPSTAVTAMWSTDADSHSAGQNGQDGPYRCGTTGAVLCERSSDDRSAAGGGAGTRPGSAAFARKPHGPAHQAAATHPILAAPPWMALQSPNPEQNALDAAPPPLAGTHY